MFNFKHQFFFFFCNCVLILSDDVDCSLFIPNPMTGECSHDCLKEGNKCVKECDENYKQVENECYSYDYFKYLYFFFKI
jgi:hypothetical protein